MSYQDEIVRAVMAWEDVTAAPHRFGGVEFNYGKVEIGHIHGSRMVDIPFTRRIREILVAQDEAERHHLLQDSGWISFYLRGPDDVAQAIRLYRLSYLQKRGRRDRAFREEVLSKELDALALTPALRAAVTGARN